MCPAPGERVELVVGVGASRGVSAGEVAGLIESVLTAEGLAPARITELATVEARAADPGLLGAAARLGVPLRGYPASALAAVDVPSPSATTLATVGTPGVAESAALLAAGPDAQLLVPKRKSTPPSGPARATCAVARRVPRAPGAIEATSRSYLAPLPGAAAAQDAEPSRPARPEPGTTPRPKAATRPGSPGPSAVPARRGKPAQDGEGSSATGTGAGPDGAPAATLSAQRGNRSHAAPAGRCEPVPRKNPMPRATPRPRGLPTRDAEPAHRAGPAPNAATARRFNPVPRGNPNPRATPRPRGHPARGSGPAHRATPAQDAVPGRGAPPQRGRAPSLRGEPAPDGKSAQDGQRRPAVARSGIRQ